MADPEHLMNQDIMADRPLVTFALFAYNQEKYIREAVEGAFSQTYEPLEIILSDDCSSDLTFEIMQEMAASYAGVHSVLVRRNEMNLGLIGHVNTVLDIAVGEVLVLAAGDDISKAVRVSKIMTVFEAHPNALLVHSMVETLDVNEKKISIKVPPNVDGTVVDIAASASIYIGATGAIRREIYDAYGPISQKETYEDLAFGFRAALKDGLFYLEQPLVKYRSNIGLASQFKRIGKSRKERRISSINHRLATLEQRRTDLRLFNHSKLKEILDILETEEKKAVARLQYHTQPNKFICRLLSKSSYVYLKALSSEIKYKIGMIG
jgi:glycosyltransferase involved in cell wall biosynthesis